MINKIKVDVANETLNMVYKEYQSAKSDADTLICAHGITHNSRVFDFLATRMSDFYKVICPDFIGRGGSDWLTNKLLYHYQTYVPHGLQLVSEVSSRKVDWIGTSMGGIIGILIASLDDNPINKLVLNDIGPIIPRATMNLANTVGNMRPLVFNTMEEVVKFFTPYIVEFGIESDEILACFSQSLVKKNNKNELIFDYDPDIFAYTRDLPHFNNMEIGFWEYWEKVKCPVLLLHGENSQTLTNDIINKMQRTHNNITLVNIPETGHAPHLMSDPYVNVIQEFLLK